MPYHYTAFMWYTCDKQLNYTLCIIYNQKHGFLYLGLCARHSVSSLKYLH